MSNLFEVTDPRGCRIICTEECWNQHILRKHSWMTQYEDEVKAAIESPSMGIYQDAQFSSRIVYYLLSTGKDRYVKVVVELKNPAQDEGEVVTAFTTDSAKPGEILIWPESST